MHTKGGRPDGPSASSQTTVNQDTSWPGPVTLQRLQEVAFGEIITVFQTTRRFTLNKQTDEDPPLMPNPTHVEMKRQPQPTQRSPADSGGRRTRKTGIRIVFSSSIVPTLFSPTAAS